jgi:hypothetical protein
LSGRDVEVRIRLRHRRPDASVEREQLQAELVPLRRRLDGLHRCVEQDDTSSNARRWLAEVEQAEERLSATIKRLDGEVGRSPSTGSPESGYLQELSARPW